MLTTEQKITFIKNFVKTHNLPDQSVCPNLYLYARYQRNRVEYTKYYNVLTGESTEEAIRSDYCNGVFTSSCRGSNQIGIYIKYHNIDDNKFVEIAEISISLARLTKEELEGKPRNWTYCNYMRRYFVFKDDKEVLAIDEYGDVIGANLSNITRCCIQSYFMVSKLAAEEVQKLEGTTVTSKRGIVYSYDKDKEMYWRENNPYHFIDKWGASRLSYKAPKAINYKLGIEDIKDEDLKKIEITDLPLKEVYEVESYGNKEISIYDRIMYIDHTTINNIKYDVIRCFALDDTTKEHHNRYYYYYYSLKTYGSEEEAKSYENKACIEFFRCYVSEKGVQTLTKQSYAGSYYVRSDNEDSPWRFESNINYIPVNTYPANIEELRNCSTKLKYFANPIISSCNECEIVTDPNEKYGGRNDKTKTFRNFNVVNTIITMLRHPVAEMLAKANVPNVFKLLMNNSTLEANIRDYLGYTNKKATSLDKKFGLSMKQLKVLDEKFKDKTNNGYYSSNYINQYLVPMMKILFNKDLSSLTPDDFSAKFDIIKKMSSNSHGYYRNSYDDLSSRVERLLDSYYIFNSQDINEEKIKWVERLNKIDFNDQSFQSARDTKSILTQLMVDYQISITKDAIRTLNDLSRLHDLALRKQNEQRDEINELKPFSPNNYYWINNGNDVLAARREKQRIIALGNDVYTEYLLAYNLNSGLGYDQHISNYNIQLVYNRLATAEDIHKFHTDVVELARIADANAAERARIKLEQETKIKLELEKRRAKVDKERQQWNYEEGEYEIRLPRSGDEIKDEGNNLHHCVGGYVTDHNRGDTTIMFLRKKVEDNKSLYTIEVKNNQIIQIHGLQNRWIQNNPELTGIVVNWIRANKFNCNRHILLSAAKGYSSSASDETKDTNIINLVDSLYKS